MIRRRQPREGDEAGFTLIEMLVAMMSRRAGGAGAGAGGGMGLGGGMNFGFGIGQP